jgi:hypothetical protein
MHHHAMSALTAQNPILTFIALYIHQIELVLVAIAMVYHLWRYRRSFFPIFYKR